MALAVVTAISNVNTRNRKVTDMTRATPLATPVDAALLDARNVLRFSESITKERQFATLGAAAARGCLAKSSLELDDIDAIVAAPGLPGYRAALATGLGVPVERITVAADEKTHTASLVAAFRGPAGQLPAGARILLIAAGAGSTAGAALYGQPAARG